MEHSVLPILSVVLVTWWLGVPVVADAQPAGNDGAADEAPDELAEYKAHQEKGIELYQAAEKEPYEAAIKAYESATIEFKAAYEAAGKKKVSPLLNVTKAYKRLHEKGHPLAAGRAVAAMKKALKNHSDELAEKKLLEPVKKELAKLESALGNITIELEPAAAKARLYVIDKNNLEYQVPIKQGLTRIPIRIGNWEIEARARTKSGKFGSNREAIEISAGKKLSVELILDGGYLSVTAHKPAAYVEIVGKDKEIIERRSWQGMLSPGKYTVRVFERGEEAHEVTIAVVAGGDHSVQQKANGELETAEAVPSAGVPVEDDRIGLYLLGSGAILAIPAQKPVHFEKDARHQTGATVGLRVGYRVTHWAAFEGMITYNLIYGDGLLDTTDLGDSTTPTGKEDERTLDYTYKAIRVGAGMRFSYPTDFWVRFVGYAGGGLSYGWMNWDISADAENYIKGVPGKSGQLGYFDDSDGVDFFIQAELGVEFEFSHVLIDVTLQNILQPSRGLEPDEVEESAFENKPLWLVGPAVHVGYMF